MSPLLVVLGVFLLIVALGIAGLVYAAYKVKQKATSYLHKVESANPAKPNEDSNQQQESDQISNAIGGLLGALNGSKAQDNPFSDLKFVAKGDYANLKCLASPAADELKPITNSRIPFVPNLKITSAWGRAPGDVEEIKMITEIKPDSFRIVSSGLTFKNENDVTGTEKSIPRTVCASDKNNSYGYVTEFGSFLPPHRARHDGEHSFSCCISRFKK